jgi:hypothetical protein
VHDPVPRTGKWLQTIVQGYLNNYAVAGNLTSVGVFAVGAGLHPKCLDGLCSGYILQGAIRQLS